MKVVYMNRILCDIIAKLIRFTIHTRLYTTTSHPDGKASWVMIAAIIGFLQLALAIIGSAKLSPPDNKRFIK